MEENYMEAVTLSPKYQVVIPKKVREHLRLQPGVKLQVISFNDRIKMIPIRSMPDMRGFLKGLNSEFERDEDDRVLIL